MSAALFKQIRELTEAVEKLKQATAEAQRRLLALEAKPASRPVGRPPKAVQ
jgi:hypothetical protein